PFSHAHNVYLQSWLEGGIFGLLGMAGLTLAMLWCGLRQPPAAGPWTMAGRLAGFGVAVAMFTTGLTDVHALTTLGGAMLLGALGVLAGTSTTLPHLGRGKPRPYAASCRVGTIPARLRPRSALVL